MANYDMNSYERHPVEDIEPCKEDEIFALQATMTLVIYDQILRRVLKSNNPKFTAWQIAYCLNSIMCSVPLKEMCRKYNVNESDAVKYCKEFSDRIGAKYSRWIVDEGEKNEVCPLFENTQIAVFIMSLVEWIINSDNPHLATWQIAYALDAQFVTQSMTKQGNALGLGHASISKGARDFCELHGLYPSKWMQTEQFAQNKKK